MSQEAKTKLRASAQSTAAAQVSGRLDQIRELSQTIEKQTEELRRTSREAPEELARALRPLAESLVEIATAYDRAFRSHLDSLSSTTDKSAARMEKAAKAQAAELREAAADAEAAAKAMRHERQALDQRQRRTGVRVAVVGGIIATISTMCLIFLGLWLGLGAAETAAILRFIAEQMTT
jgi:chromosome segregation ATPase